MATEHFSSSWKEARNKFIATCRNANLEVESLPLDGCSDPEGNSLFIDTVCIGSKNPKKVLVHFSGTHGVEGFAGSAIQIDFLSDIPALDEDVTIMLIHGLNAFGMSHHRRWNENNVDLNRNCPLDQQYEPRGAPAEYEALEDFINPKEEPYSWTWNFYSVTIYRSDN